MVQSTNGESNEGGEKNHEFYHDPYGLIPKPRRTNYREAIQLFSAEDSLVDLSKDPIYDKICLLTKKDRSFYQRLQKDGRFHAVFWYRINCNNHWTPRSETEWRDLVNIDLAIVNRIELVLLWKILLGKFIHLQSEPEQNRILKVADSELMFAQQWFKPYMTNYEKIYPKFLKIRSLDFLKEHDPNWSTYPYKCKDWANFIDWPITTAKSHKKRRKMRQRAR